MRDNSNVQDKENALKFFLEICTLLKSINLTNRQLQTCNSAFTKIMLVLAQIFDVMLPDKHTLLAEVIGDKEGLIKLFEYRAQKDLEKGNKTTTDPKETSENKNEAREKEEFKNSPGPPLVTPEKAHDSFYDIGETQTPVATGGSRKDYVINPGRATLEEYLKNPIHSEDPSMTQIDILKSNSIEIFYNLLILLNNVNTSTIRDFLCSEN